MQDQLTESQVLKIMEKYDRDAQQLIAVLLDIQAESGANYVDEKWSALCARVLNVPLSKIYDILTFYAMFSSVPRGEYVIEICKSTPCCFTGSREVEGWFEQVLGIKMGETSPDRKFTLSNTCCVGACDVGPVAKIGDEVYGDLTLEKVNTLLRSYREGLPTHREALACQN
ncbi:MAG: NAD(P)H-dependent oxidoreductase subunit E [Candidatus Adiutrix sp.]|jgi:NADH-quinone oxidoreductase subunit E|nr:NAD(P)H-dependent oxidoreductase subunit E [Candidatus Adiutrix sp.]